MLGRAFSMMCRQLPESCASRPGCLSDDSRVEAAHDHSERRAAAAAMLQSSSAFAVRTQASQQRSTDGSAERSQALTERRKLLTELKNGVSERENGLTQGSGAHASEVDRGQRGVE